MNMNLNADLAVLSACETANGRISPGEGVMGTSLAFLVAGTRSMLVSQWKVNSSSTSQLMMHFYQALESRQNEPSGKKARSLQEATLRLMKDDRYRHPFYWAGFVLIGSKCSLSTGVVDASFFLYTTTNDLLPEAHRRSPSLTVSIAAIVGIVFIAVAVQLIGRLVDDTKVELWQSAESDVMGNKKPANRSWSGQSLGIISEIVGHFQR
jgi:CHAT domain